MKSNWTQEEAFAAVNMKPIWGSLKLSEKKKAFQYLVGALKIEVGLMERISLTYIKEREDAKRKEQQIRDDFVQALFDCPDVVPGTSFR
jgi:hypothetical protein